MKLFLYLAMGCLAGCAGLSGLYREQRLNRALYPRVGDHRYAQSRETILAAVQEQIRADRAWHRRHDPLVQTLGLLADGPIAEPLENGTRVTGWREYYWVVADPQRPGKFFVRVREKTEQADRIPYKEWQILRRLEPSAAEAVKTAALAEDPELNFDPYAEG